MVLKPTARLLSAGCLFALISTTPSQAAPGKPDAQMQAVLDQLAALNPKPLEKLTPPEARKQPTPADAVKALLKRQGKDTAPEAVGKVEDKAIDGPGGKIPIRIYTPKGDGPFPVLVYWHGGGFVIADLDTYDSSPRALCNAAGCVVVSCHYRQAPEHKFPAAPADAFAAYQWVLKHAKELKGNPEKIAVAGESAGGNLAAGVTLRARDEKVQLPVHQVLVYPVTDNNLNTESYLAHADAKPLNRPMMLWFFGHYLKDPKDGEDPRVSVAKARDMTGLPPTTIILAEIDPLHDDGLVYAAGFQKAKVPVKVINFEGVTHEFFGMGAVVDKAKDAVKAAADGLKMGFGK